MKSLSKSSPKSDVYKQKVGSEITVKNVRPATIAYNNLNIFTDTPEVSLLTRGALEVIHTKVKPSLFRLSNLESHYETIQSQNREIQRLQSEVSKLRRKLAPYEKQLKDIEQVNTIKDNYFKDMVQSSEFGNLLGCTRQNINRLRREHKLIAVSGKNGNYFPKWQLNRFNEPYGCIQNVLNLIGVDNQWTQIQFFSTPSDILEGMPPKEYLKLDDAQESLVIRAAKVHNEQSLT
ncbi:hypothetical protein [Shewanella algicola]|uniref:hypothetical protein n=1 Tax=Shewanella algicola TaxID=640633 RepID=UPI002494D84B|nr:hypothetical protein [Shewanella algicola]